MVLFLFIFLVFISYLHQLLIIEDTKKTPENCDILQQQRKNQIKLFVDLRIKTVNLITN